MPSDSRVFSKSVKHAAFDIVTLGFCELWYKRVRSTYAELQERRASEQEKMAKRAAKEQAALRRKMELKQRQEDEERKRAEEKQKAAAERKRLIARRKRELEYTTLTQGLNTYMAMAGGAVERENSFAAWCTLNSEIIKVSKIVPKSAFERKRKAYAEKVIVSVRKEEKKRLLEAHKRCFSDYKNRLRDDYDQISIRLKKIPKGDGVLSLEDEQRLSESTLKIYRDLTAKSFEEAFKVGVFESELNMQEELKEFVGSLSKNESWLQSSMPQNVNAETTKAKEP